MEPAYPSDSHHTCLQLLVSGPKIEQFDNYSQYQFTPMTNVVKSASLLTKKGPGSQKPSNPKCQVQNPHKDVNYYEQQARASSEVGLCERLPVRSSLAMQSARSYITKMMQCVKKTKLKSGQVNKHDSANQHRLTMLQKLQKCRNAAKLTIDLTSSFIVLCLVPHIPPRFATLLIMLRPALLPKKDQMIISLVELAPAERCTGNEFGTLLGCRLF